MRGKAMAESVSEAEIGAGTLDAASTTRSFGVVFATSLLIVLMDFADGSLFNVDVDDRLRELQIRFLLSEKGSWYDPALPFIAMPAPYLSPWSRLVDLPYVVIAKGLSLVMSAGQALQAAFWIWPLVMLAVFSLLVTSLATRFLFISTLPQRTRMIALALMTMFMAIAVLEFVPGRIDHHNVQILALLAIALGVCRWDRVGGMLIGLASAASLIVGLEGLPFVAFAYAALVGAFVLDVRGARAMLWTASLGMFAATVCGAVAFLGVPGILSVQCDAFSAPYIVLMLCFSGILGLCCLMVRGNAFVRLAALAIPSVALSGVAGFGFRACLAGPYAVIDPLSQAYWFDRIWQEHSILYFYAGERYSLVVLFALLAAVLLAVAPLAVRQARSTFAPWLIVYGLAVVALVLTVVQTRYIRFPIALAPLFLPVLIGWAADGADRNYGRRAMIGAVALCWTILAGLFFLVPPFQPAADAVDFMASDQCTGQDFSVLDAVTPGRIAAPSGVGMPILFTAPDGFSVAALPFHRASPGMKRMYEAFLSTDPAIRRAALAPFDYVVVCRSPVAADPQRAPLYAALSAGKDWPGLVRMKPPHESGFQLFRIDHAALR
ncbi:MAG: hypothetical protein ACT6WE_16265 [Shinella sp.]|uniref:hypothetical protein n=1 Tax=Shinella sp. TaxID=1870904 RepID=UPI004036ABBF